MICNNCKFYDAEHRICRNIKARYVGSDECYKRQKKKANADRIRSMTDEELANLMAPLDCSSCPLDKEGHCYGDYGKNTCYDGFLAWLREEVNP